MALNRWGRSVGVALVAEDGDGAHLGQRLDHQHPGQRGPAGEVPGEEPLLARQPPPTDGGLAGHHVANIDSRLGHTVKTTGGRAGTLQ